MGARVIRARAFLAPLAVVGMLFALPCRVEAAGGAYAVDDADIGKPGSCQNEAWVSYATSHDFVGITSPACVVKIGIPVEFTALYQRSRTGDLWTTAPSGQAKIVPINNDTFAFSLASGFIWDSATQTTSAFVNMPLTFKFGGDFRIHANAGFVRDNRVGVDYASGGVGFDWDFRPKFSLMGEVYLQEGKHLQTIPRMVTDPRAQIGLRYIPISTVDIDLIFGHNITGRNAQWLTFGLTVRSE